MILTMLCIIKKSEVSHESFCCEKSEPKVDDSGWSCKEECFHCILKTGFCKCVPMQDGQARLLHDGEEINLFQGSFNRWVSVVLCLWLKKDKSMLVLL